jgi:hypothetical protein
MKNIYIGLLTSATIFSVFAFTLNNSGNKNLIIKNNDCTYPFPNVSNGVITSFNEQTGHYMFKAISPCCGKERSSTQDSESGRVGNRQYNYDCPNNKCGKSYTVIVSWGDKKCK